MSLVERIAEALARSFVGGGHMSLVERVAEALAHYAGYEGLGPRPEYWLGMAQVALDAVQTNPPHCDRCLHVTANEEPDFDLAAALERKEP